MIEKTKLDITFLLPTVQDVRDACIQRLSDSLKSRAGIDHAHLSNTSADGTGQICIHYDPDQISIGEVRELAKRAGADLDRRFGHLLVTSATLTANRALTIEAKMKAIAGILEVSVSPVGMVRIEFDRELTDEVKVRAALDQLLQTELEVDTAREGERPVEKAVGQPGAAKHAHTHAGILGEKAELVFAISCGVCLLIAWLLSSFSTIGFWVPLGFYVAAYFFGGFFPLREAVDSISVGRFEIDFLMLVAAVGAATLDKWAEGALLLFLFSLGHSLEHFAMGRAKRAIEALAELAPQFALVRRGASLVEIPVEQLQLEDVVVIKPNERLPADGFVIKGEGSINQAPITGESVPVDKRPVPDVSKATVQPEKLDAQHRVFAGTINNSGSFEIQVTKVAADSTLARVAQMVKEAETQKSPTQRFTDKFERYFVPTVLAVVCLLLFAWLVVDEPFSDSFYRSMAVLVAASPCALAISTPSAVLSGVARAARGGVLVKGGGPLENLGRLTAIAFDKTGTLTEGKPRLTDVIALNGVAEEELLRIAIALETLSDHPLAAAVVTGGQQRLAHVPIPEALDLQSITGQGIKATVENQLVTIGKAGLFISAFGPLPEPLHLTVEKLKFSGRTTMIVRRGEVYLGVLGLMDTPRASAQKVIERLRIHGIQRMIMLSGDNQQVADAVAREVGIDEAFGDLMPDAKVEMIRKLSHVNGVAMVGDGVNDAPAMANATVGIAMGAAGSDVALETADVALMADDLNTLPFAVGLSRQTNRIIKQNLWLSLGMVAFLVPATLLGLRLGPAVILHEGSTLLVVLNALRLLAFQDRETA